MVINHLLSGMILQVGLFFFSGEFLGWAKGSFLSWGIHFSEHEMKNPWWNGIGINYHIQIWIEKKIHMYKCRVISWFQQILMPKKTVSVLK